MKNLSVGVFTNGTEVVRKIFCDDKVKPISPFGWLENIDSFKLTGSVHSMRFAYIKKQQKSANLFVDIPSNDIIRVVKASIEVEYGSEFVNCISLYYDSETSRCVLQVNSLDNVMAGRSRILSVVEKKNMGIQLRGITGTLFIEVNANDSVNNLALLRKKIELSTQDWHEIIKRVRTEYPNNWRQTLNSIGRHDLIFRYDIENFIKYGK